MTQFNYQAYKAGTTLTLATGILLLLFSLLGGKEDLFLLMNQNLGAAADGFFKYFTNAGDGLIWVPLGLYCILFNRRLLPLVFSAIIISTLLVQTGKKIIYPNEARPTAAIEATVQNPIHTVPGVTVHSNNSFPSGHTTTAFSVFLLACLMLPYRYFWLIGFSAAGLAGYSRIYLAQHFPLDVGAGMLCAVITVYIALNIQKRWFKKQVA